MKIGILYVAIGKYDFFFHEFYESSEKFLLKDFLKKYFVFTDSLGLKEKYKNCENIEFIDVLDLGWYKNTSLRFQMFLSIEEKLKMQDYIFFFNANYKFLDFINYNEIIPMEKENFLVSLSWSLYLKKDKKKYPYDRNKKSQCYISYGLGQKYYQGGFNGGRASEYLHLIKKCKSMIDIDIGNGIVAKYGDESCLNKYLLDKEIKTVDEFYGCPTEWGCSSQVKAIIRDKNEFWSEKEVDKMKKVSLYMKIKRKISRLKRKFFKERLWCHH